LKSHAAANYFVLTSIPGNKLIY